MSKKIWILLLTIVILVSLNYVCMKVNILSSFLIDCVIIIFLASLGDGEPDRDFPAYNGEQRLRDIQSDEFCLCELEDRQPIRTYSYNDSLFSPPPLVNSHSDKSTMSASSSYKIRDPFAGSPFSDDVDSPPRITPQLENSVTIRFPDGKAMTVEHGEEATLRDLLPSIAKQHRIRIYTDEYEFLISTQDQKMLSVREIFSLYLSSYHRISNDFFSF